MKKVLLFSTLISLITAHSIPTKPPMRGTAAGSCGEEEGCSGPCESPYNEDLYKWGRNKQIYKRGQEIDVEWLRLNHPGGFVRLAIVPTSESASKEAFDNNVYQYSCFESNCKQDNNIDDAFWGYMAGPNFANHSPTCSTKFTIPQNLQDGDYTIQWIWYAGGVNTGDRFRAFGNYYGCSDFKVNGGNVGAKPPVSFIGKDVVTSDPKQCRYWGKNDVKSCAKSYDPSNPSKCPKGGPKLGAPKEFCQNGEDGIPFVAPQEYRKKNPNAEIMPNFEINWTPPPQYDPNSNSKGPFIPTTHQNNNNQQQNNKQQNNNNNQQQQNNNQYQVNPIQGQTPPQGTPVPDQKPPVWVPPAGYNPGWTPPPGYNPGWVPPPGYNPYAQTK